MKEQVKIELSEEKVRALRAHIKVLDGEHKLIITLGVTVGTRPSIYNLSLLFSPFRPTAENRNTKSQKVDILEKLIKGRRISPQEWTDLNKGIFSSRTKQLLKSQGITRASVVDESLDITLPQATR